MKTKATYIHFCKILREDKDEIIHIWKERIKNVLEVANNQSSLILIDHLPQIISNLSDILESEGRDIVDASDLKKKDELGKAHGRQRAIQTNYSLEEVLTEYTVLRSVIIEKVFLVNTNDLDATKIIHKYIDEGIQHAVIEFVKIQNAQIEKGITELKKEKDLRESFVSALTHDLRTPLTAARMSVQFIKKDPHNAENVHKQIVRIIANVDRIDGMIQDLLDANLIKAGKNLPIHLSECNLKDIIEETLADLIINYGDRFIANVPAHIYFKCSRDGIRRMIENLCSNAVKYGTPKTSIKIVINEDSENLVISVHNQGSVIPQDEIDELFDQFQRSDSALSSGQKGWGIGLTLVKGLVEAHNGSISVVSNASEGTIFRITLPKSE